MPPARLRRRLARALGALALALAGAWACSMPVGPAPDATGPSPAPSPGDGPDALRAAATASPAPGTRVALVEWRELAVRGGTLDADPEALAGADARAVAVHRRCRRQTGWLDARETGRSSWYLLRQGRLVAFEHVSFDASCGAHWTVRPAAEADRPVVRALERYVAQRHPEGVPELAERIARTTARIEAGQPEPTTSLLERADRSIARLQRQLERGAFDEEERLAHRARLDALEGARSQLLRATRGREPAAATRTEGGSAGEAASSSGPSPLLKPGAPAPRSAGP